MAEIIGEALDFLVMLARLKVAERRCRSLRDYFHLIQRISRGPGQKETEIVSFLEAASKLPIESGLEIATGRGERSIFCARLQRPMQL